MAAPVTVTPKNHPQIQWSNEQQEQRTNPKSYALSGKIMFTSIVVLFAVVVFLVVLHLYARWYLLRVQRRNHSRRRSRRNRPTHLVFYVDSNGGLAVPSGGLDASVLKSLPVFVYSPETHRSSPECAVCLSEFEEGEKGRNLPKCHHSFHTECIDMWFHTHSTCPLCRSPVEPVEPDFVISIQEPESLPRRGSVQDGENSGTTSLADRRKGLDMRIDVPSRTELVTEDEFRLPSPASQGFRSPGSRLLSLKKILSMNRKSSAPSPSPSPSSGVGTSCSPVCTESERESARDESTQVPTRPTTPR